MISLDIKAPQIYDIPHREVLNTYGGRVYGHSCNIISHSRIYIQRRELELEEKLAIRNLLSLGWF